MRQQLTKERFIELWNKAESLPDFCEVTGYKYNTASSTASRLRSDGNQIKSFITVDHYQRIGSIGGKKGTTGGFYANRDLAREAGRRGGRISRRTTK